MQQKYKQKCQYFLPAPQWIALAPHSGDQQSKAVEYKMGSPQPVLGHSHFGTSL